MLADAIQFIVAPGKFPRHLSYVLVRDEHFIPETLTFLRAFAPSAPFLGYVPITVSARDIDETTAVVVSSRRWASVVATLTTRRFTPSRIHVLLNPEDDSMGYLTLGRCCLDHLRELTDPSVPITNKVRWLREHLTRYAYVQFEGDQPIWYPDCYFTPFRDRVRTHASTIHDILIRLGDRTSREAYNLVLYGSPEELLESYLGRVFHEQQYVEMTHLRPGDVIVNAGIGSGWDVPYLVAQTRGQGRHLLVDPKEVYDGSDIAPVLHAFPFETVQAALWDRRAKLRFPVDRYGMMVSTRPGEELLGHTTQTVPCRPLDDIVRERRLERIDLIKLDIEGAEERALLGMKETLTRFRPQLAVCLYHEPEHMWTIPSRLMSWLKDYHFFVRHYSYLRFECLLYAIPAERLPQPVDRSESNRFEEAGLDSGLLEHTWNYLCGSRGIDDALHGQTGKSAHGRVAELARCVDTEVERAFWSAPVQTIRPSVEIHTALAEFLGTGWGPAGMTGDRASWRWLGPDGTASVFLHLAHDVDHRCRVYLHHADSQEAFDRLALEANGLECPDRHVSMDGELYFVEWRIPAQALREHQGRCRLRLRCVPGTKRMSISKVRCWQIA